MGQIGRFIDKACDAHPTLMRKVLDRPFGTLGSWIDFDEVGEACGCLIGTMALCAGYDADRPCGDDDCERDDASDDGSAVQYVTALMGEQPWQRELLAIDVGYRVADVARRLGRRSGSDQFPWWEATPESDAMTAELIKRRIARRLGVTYARPVVEVQHA
jgi:hypothetical protein